MFQYYVLAIFSTLLAVGTSAPTVQSWLLEEVEDNIRDRNFLQENRLFRDLKDQIEKDLVIYGDKYFFSPSNSYTWTISDLEKKLNELKETPEEYRDETLRKALERSLIYAQRNNKEGVSVLKPAWQILTWELEDLEQAIQHEETVKNPEAAEYLKDLKFRHDLLEENSRNGKWTIIGSVTYIADKDEDDVSHSVKLPGDKY